MYGPDRREPTGVRDTRDYNTIVATGTKTGRPNNNCTIGYARMHVLSVLTLLPTYKATILRFLARRALPVASRC
jgi:hypothetical protein